MKVKPTKINEVTTTFYVLPPLLFTACAAQPLSIPIHGVVHTVLRPRNLELEDSCMPRVEAMIVAYELVS